AIPGPGPRHLRVPPARPAGRPGEALAGRAGVAGHPGDRGVPGRPRPGPADPGRVRRHRGRPGGRRPGPAGDRRGLAVARGRHHHAPLLRRHRVHAGRQRAQLRPGVGAAGGHREQQPARRLRLRRGPPAAGHPVPDDDRDPGRGRLPGQRREEAVQPVPVDGPAHRGHLGHRRRARAAAGLPADAVHLGRCLPAPVLDQPGAGRRGERRGPADRRVRRGPAGHADRLRGRRRARRAADAGVHLVRAADLRLLPGCGQCAGRAGAGRPARPGRGPGRDGDPAGDGGPAAGGRRPPAGRRGAREGGQRGARRRADRPVRRPGRDRGRGPHRGGAARRDGLHPLRRRLLPGRRAPGARLPPAVPGQHRRIAGRVPGGLRPRARQL
ncbi:MAG: Butyryl-CoA dehydrogenase, partial [uncultured Corynebacteriales bacterium]